MKIRDLGEWQLTRWLKPDGDACALKQDYERRNTRIVVFEDARLLAVAHKLVENLLVPVAQCQDLRAPFAGQDPHFGISDECGCAMGAMVDHMWWLCDAATRITLSDDVISGVLENLAAEAHRAADWIPTRAEPAYPEGASPQERQKIKDGRGWRFVRRAAALPLPLHLRAKRDALIARISSDPEHAYTAMTLAFTTDSRVDSRRLTPNEISALVSLLALPRPITDDRLVRTARNPIHH